MLNLSKNNISAIEGLRELTRLRVLDLSYNRIFRIGHGIYSTQQKALGFGHFSFPKVDLVTYLLHLIFA